MKSNSSTARLGQQGETIAADYLVRMGYTIITRNWRTRLGEIDIVAKDQNGEWVFVEVKTRRAADANPLEALTPRKQKSLVRAAYDYIQKTQLTDAAWRIDVIAIVLIPGASPQIEMVQDALDWSN